MSLWHQGSISEQSAVVFGVLLRVCAVRAHHDHAVDVGALLAAGAGEAGPLVHLADVGLVVGAARDELDHVVVGDVQQRGHDLLAAAQPQRLHPDLDRQHAAPPRPHLPLTSAPRCQLRL